MPTTRIVALCLLLLLSLSGCTPSDPLTALEEAVQRLQDNLEAKDSSAVLDQLHPQFLAQNQQERDWARRTMALLFLRHQQVRVHALSKHSEIDAIYSNKGHTQAQVALTGAQGLIPDAARHYSVKLEWWREGDDWKLARLNWE